jgi:hypothetical protein
MARAHLSFSLGRACLRVPPSGAPELGAAAQARLRHRPRTMPVLWRRAEDQTTDTSTTTGGRSRSVLLTVDNFSAKAASSRSWASEALSAPILIVMRIWSRDVGTPVIPTAPRASNSLCMLTFISRSSMPCRAACAAIAVAVHDAIDARKSQPGFGPVPSPPIEPGMSVTAFSPADPLISHRSPPRQTAVAEDVALRAADGRSRNSR